MADLCAEVVKVVEPAYENRHLTIETEIEDTVLTVNRELLVTALVNLMDNARKASGKKVSRLRLQEKLWTIWLVIYVKIKRI